MLGHPKKSNVKYEVISVSWVSLSAAKSNGQGHASNARFTTGHIMTSSLNMQCALYIFISHTDRLHPIPAQHTQTMTERPLLFIEGTLPVRDKTHDHISCPITYHGQINAFRPPKLPEGGLCKVHENNQCTAERTSSSEQRENRLRKHESMTLRRSVDDQSPKRERGSPQKGYKQSLVLDDFCTRTRLVKVAARGADSVRVS